MTSFTPMHRWPIRVYYEDTDFSGVVYHANYLRFLERGRTEFLREAGVDQTQLFTSGQAFAVRGMTLDFRAAARMDDGLIVTSAIEALGGASITLRQAIARGEAILVAAVVRIGLVANGRATRLPRSLIEKLAATTTSPIGA